MTPNDWAVVRARHEATFSEVRVEQSTLTLFESAQSWVAVDALCMAGRCRASGEMAGSLFHQGEVETLSFPPLSSSPNMVISSATPEQLGKCVRFLCALRL